VVIRVIRPSTGADIYDVDVISPDHVSGVRVDIGYPEFLGPLLGQIVVYIAKGHHLAQG
jgi:hypothetical protein